MATANSLFEKALAAEGISGQLADVARSIYMQESGGGRNTKTSNQGHRPEVQAHGGMQILKGTFRSVADKGWDINNPEHNARAGIRYLKQLDQMSGGDPRLTAAGYYGGPGGMAKAKKGIAVSDPRNPKAPNTLEYGDQVVARMGRESLGRNQQTAAVAPAIAAGAPAPSTVVAAPVPVQAIDQQAIVPLPPEVAQVAAAPAQAPIGRQAENAWADFQQNLVQRQKSQAQALASYGKGAPVKGAFVNPIREVNMMDSLKALQQPAGTQADFRSFGKWGNA